MTELRDFPAVRCARMVFYNLVSLLDQKRGCEPLWQAQCICVGFGKQPLLPDNFGSEIPVLGASFFSIAIWIGMNDGSHCLSISLAVETTPGQAWHVSDRRLTAFYIIYNQSD